ncbi:MAG: hypothetical protein HDR13_10935 [Lachnospiraceae bacterium]|nr:hypothetical protein [Lachnospiraceae bacterium]
MNVRTFVGKRGEDHFEEIDLDKYLGILKVEMSENSIRVKGLEFKRKEDVDVHTRIY